MVEAKATEAALELLKARPGELARRLAAFHKGEVIGGDLQDLQLRYMTGTWTAKTA